MDPGPYPAGLFLCSSDGVPEALAIAWSVLFSCLLGVIYICRYSCKFWGYIWYSSLPLSPDADWTILCDADTTGFWIEEICCKSCFYVVRLTLTCEKFSDVCKTHNRRDVLQSQSLDSRVITHAHHDLTWKNFKSFGLRVQLILNHNSLSKNAQKKGRWWWVCK